MKLFSGKSKKRQRVVNAETRSNNTSVTETKPQQTPVRKASTAPTRGRSGGMSTKKKLIVVLSSILGLALILGASTFAVVYWEIQPFYDNFFKPGVDALAQQPGPARAPVVVAAETEEPDVEPDVEPEPIVEDEDVVEEDLSLRKEDVFTFLILGIDLHGNTDVVMVATFDAINSTLDVVSIPRDTIVNVPWNLKKVNSIHPHARNMYRGQDIASDDVVAETIKHFRTMLGYNLDYVVSISFGAFPRIVDAVGPIEFDVPFNVSVDGLNVARGRQRLNGQQALAVMRDRGNAPNGDIGRANTQQLFLNTVMRQFLANRSNIRVDDMAEIFLRHTNTNIQLNHLAWLGREFLRMDANNITFHMMPGEFETLRGNFYISIQLEPWLKLINDHLSPLTYEITEQDVSILTRGPDRRLYVTDGDYQGSPTWGGTGTGSRNPQTTTGEQP